jgi:hypothetical protein
MDMQQLGKSDLEITRIGLSAWEVEGMEPFLMENPRSESKHRIIDLEFSKT